MSHTAGRNFSQTSRRKLLAFVTLIINISASSNFSNNLMHTILCFKHSTGPSYSSLLKSKSFASSDLLNYTLNVLNRNGPSLLSRVLPVKLWQVRWHRFCSKWNNVRHGVLCIVNWSCCGLLKSKLWGCGTPNICCRWSASDAEGNLVPWIIFFTCWRKLLAMS